MTTHVFAACLFVYIIESHIKVVQMSSATLQCVVHNIVNSIYENKEDTWDFVRRWEFNEDDDGDLPEAFVNAMNIASTNRAKVRAVTKTILDTLSLYGDRSFEFHGVWGEVFAHVNDDEAVCALLKEEADARETRKQMLLQKKKDEADAEEERQAHIVLDSKRRMEAREAAHRELAARDALRTKAQDERVVKAREVADSYVGLEPRVFSATDAAVFTVWTGADLQTCLTESVITNLRHLMNLKTEFTADVTRALCADETCADIDITCATIEHDDRGSRGIEIDSVLCAVAAILGMPSLTVHAGTSQHTIVFRGRVDDGEDKAIRVRSYNKSEASYVLRDALLRTVACSVLGIGIPLERILIADIDSESDGDKRMLLVTVTEIMSGTLDDFLSPYNSGSGCTSTEIKTKEAWLPPRIEALQRAQMALELCHRMSTLTKDVVPSFFHNDAKPNNFLRDAAGRLYLIDFDDARLQVSDFGNPERVFMEKNLGEHMCNGAFADAVSTALVSMAGNTLYKSCQKKKSTENLLKLFVKRNMHQGVRNLVIAKIRERMVTGSEAPKKKRK